MNLPSCSCGGRLLVYVTRRFTNHTVRYRRCSHCRTTDKAVQMISVIPSESSTDHPRSASHVNLKSITNRQNQSLEETKNGSHDGHDGSFEPNQVRTC
jgi:hypothetical protein